MSYNDEIRRINGLAYASAAESNNSNPVAVHAGVRVQHLQHWQSLPVVLLPVPLPEAVPVSIATSTSTAIASASTTSTSSVQPMELEPQHHETYQHDITDTSTGNLAEPVHHQDWRDFDDRIDILGFINDAGEARRIAPQQHESSACALASIDIVCDSMFVDDSAELDESITSSKSFASGGLVLPRDPPCRCFQDGFQCGQRRLLLSEQAELQPPRPPSNSQRELSDASNDTRFVIDIDVHAYDADKDVDLIQDFQSRQGTLKLNNNDLCSFFSNWPKKAWVEWKREYVRGYGMYCDAFEFHNNPNHAAAPVPYSCKFTWKLIVVFLAQFVGPWWRPFLSGISLICISYLHSDLQTQIFASVVSVMFIISGSRGTQSSKLSDFHFWTSCGTIVVDMIFGIFFCAIFFHVHNSWLSIFSVVGYFSPHICVVFWFGCCHDEYRDRDLDL